MFRKLLVPLDRSPLAEQALGAAASIARASGAKIELVLVHQPVPFAGFKDVPWNAEQAKDEEEYLAATATELETGASISATHTLLRGDVIKTICEHARDIDADLIVMTSHGRTGLSRLWLGSVADAVVRQSEIPVLMLRPVETKVDRKAAYPPFQRILVPLDGSALSVSILPTASELARCGKAGLMLLRVVQPVPLVMPSAGAPFVYSRVMQDDAATKQLVEEARKELAEEAHSLEGDECGDVETYVVVADNVAQAIVDFATKNGVGAIAMSTHGRGASRLLVGSVADKVLRAGAAPILLRRTVGISEDLGTLSSTSVAQQLSALANVRY
jgi:nucleotide-binding universal stress UspA family protein